MTWHGAQAQALVIGRCLEVSVILFMVRGLQIILILEFFVVCLYLCGTGDAFRTVWKKLSLKGFHTCCEQLHCIPRRSIASRKRERRESQRPVESPRIATEKLRAKEDLSKPHNEATCTKMQTSLYGGAEITGEHITFYSLDELFPNCNVSISRLFNTNSTFRSDLRKAARDDFFVPDEKLSAQSNLALKDPRSTMMSSWRMTSNQYVHLSTVFQKYECRLSGKDFIEKFTSFCNTPNSFGSWIDICGVKDKHVPHSWHQDSGLDQVTVMVGFPPEDNYEGIGVFSHAFQLTHRLPPPLLKQPRLWVCSDNSFPLGNELPSRIEEEYIIRPIYRPFKGIRIFFHLSHDFYNCATYSNSS